ncbi:MAG: hypothetical protein UY41_C0048G0004 [Candidatus Moranbacteria bacterium GW2011_GWE1_49_15]|nr:MAG: hypothetical protein UY41_C0048G0004 [Candidatus Moranbacteria bacterium GW2011_GWE1_49_15]
MMRVLGVVGVILAGFLLGSFCISPTDAPEAVGPILGTGLGVVFAAVLFP